MFTGKLKVYAYEGAGRDTMSSSHCRSNFQERKIDHLATQSLTLPLCPCFCFFLSQSLSPRNGERQNSEGNQCPDCTPPLVSGSVKLGNDPALEASSGMWEPHFIPCRSLGSLLALRHLSAWPVIWRTGRLMGLPSATILLPQNWMADEYPILGCKA